MNSLRVVYLASVIFVVSTIFMFIPTARTPQTLLARPITEEIPTPTPQDVVITTQSEAESPPIQNVTVVPTIPTIPPFTFEPLEHRVPRDPQRNTFFASLDSVNASVKIGFVVMLYENTHMLFRLIRTIYRDYHEYVIVMDTKNVNDWNLLKDMYGNMTNVRLLSRRVCYSTTSMVLVEIEAARMLLERDVDYVTSLSNRDYPLRPLSELEKFLTWKKGWSFINVLEVPETHLKNGFQKFYLDVDCTRNGMRQTELFRPDIGFKMYFGSQWHTMSRELVSWILDSPLSYYVVSWLSTASNSDEFFWSTMAAYSPYIDKVQTQSLTYVAWDQGCDVYPCTLVLSMWDHISSHKLFWGRKFKTEVPESVALLDYLDHHVHDLY